MQYFIDFISNRILVCGLLSWIIAQIIKALIYGLMNHSWDIHRLFGDGGMPSGHSATVVAVATVSAFREGFGSPVFALALILAIIVMHDAMGVRQETGKHAKAINELMALLQPDSTATSDEKLKEFLGHTPLQVLCGGIIGFVVGLVGGYFIA